GSAQNGRNKRKPSPWVATGFLRRSMVSRASAVGCHPLQEVPPCEGGGRLADPRAVPDDPLTEAIHYARLCRIWYSRARPCTWIEVRGHIEVRGAEVRRCAGERTLAHPGVVTHRRAR